MKKDHCEVCIIDERELILPIKIQGKLLYCTCPFCKRKVAADIYRGRITCPACSMSASWKD